MSRMQVLLAQEIPQLQRAPFSTAGKLRISIRMAPGRWATMRKGGSEWPDRIRPAPSSPTPCAKGKPAKEGPSH